MVSATDTALFPGGLSLSAVIVILLVNVVADGRRDRSRRCEGADWHIRDLGIEASSFPGSTPTDAETVPSVAAWQRDVDHDVPGDGIRAHDDHRETNQVPASRSHRFVTESRMSVTAGRGKAATRSRRVVGVIRGADAYVRTPVSQPASHEPG